MAGMFLEIGHKKMSKCLVAQNPDPSQQVVEGPEWMVAEDWSDSRLMIARMDGIP
jgi:hypothetical protein